MQLSAKQAIVKTISVEIKALTLEKKQVTQSVFKQLDKKDLVDYVNRKLNGNAWGRVNYHPDKCENHSPHIHVVWQDGEHLYRDSLYYPFNRSGHYFKSENDKFNECFRSFQKQARQVNLAPELFSEKVELAESFHLQIYKESENLDLLFIAV